MVSLVLEGYDGVITYANQRREAGRLPPLAGVADDAVVALQDQDDQVVVHVAVVGVAGLVWSSSRGLSWCPKPMVELCP